MRTREILAYLAVGAAAAVLSAASGGAALAQQNDEILFRSETRVVEVTLVATDTQGRPVDDLRPEEIRVVDRGDEQRIQHFQIVPRTPGAEAVNLRHTIFLIDDLNTDIAERPRIRAALAQAFPSGVRAEDRVSIVRLGAEGRVLLDFAQDARRLAALLDEPPVVMLANYDSVELEARIAVAARMFQAIAQRFAKTPGQKNLVWISSGFPLSIAAFVSPQRGWQLFPGRLGPDCPPHLSPISIAAEYYTLPSTSSQHPGCGQDPGGAGSPSPVSIRSYHGLLLPAIRELNAANVSLYAVDTGGLRYADGFAAQQAMRYLARQTGGVAYAGRGDTAELIRQTLDDSQAGYVLTYAPSNYADNDLYHRIRVKATREGVKLRYRRGYYPRNDEPQP